jgi:hypothetical protein
MTSVDLARSNGHDLTDAEVRRAAEDVVRQADATGQKLTGAELGHRFGRTDRWGRTQIARARTTGSEGPSVAPRERTDTTPSRNGSSPSRNGSTPVPFPPVPEHRPGGGTERPEADPAGRRPSWLDMAAMLVVAAVAAAASYGHMLHVATMAGESLWIARLFPVTVDGLMLIALRHNSREARWWLALGIAVSVAANIAAAHPTLEGRLVAAWPPLSLLGAHRLIHGRRHPS